MRDPRNRSDWPVMAACLISSGRVTSLRRLLSNMSRHVSLSLSGTTPENRRPLPLPPSFACTLFSLFLLLRQLAACVCPLLL